MTRGRILILSFASAFLAEVAGWSQDRPNGFLLTSPLSLSAGYDDNFVANSGYLSDSVSILTAPTFSWMKSTHRTTFAADYQAEFEVFSRYKDLNAWNHSSILRYGYRINSRLSVDAGNSFLSTSDASRQLAESQFLLPRGRFQQNSFYAGLKYRFDRRTVMTFHFDNAITTFASSGQLSKPFDQMTYAGKAMLERTINRHHTVTGSYAYVHVRPLDQAGSAVYSYQAVHSLDAGYMYTVTPGLIFRATGGVVRGREFAYTAGGAVEKQMGRIWMMAGYQRYLSFLGGFAPSVGTVGETSPFASSLLPNSLYQAVTLRVKGMLTKRVGLDLNGQLGRVRFGEVGVRSLIAQSRLDYRLNKRLVLFARVDYYGQNVGQFSATPLKRSRYFGGLEIALSRSPDAESAARLREIPPAGATGPQAEEPLAPEEK